MVGVKYVKYGGGSMLLWGWTGPGHHVRTQCIMGIMDILNQTRTASAKTLKLSEIPNRHRKRQNQHLLKN